MHNFEHKNQRNFNFFIGSGRSSWNNRNIGSKWAETLKTDIRYKSGFFFSEKRCGIIGKNRKLGKYLRIIVLFSNKMKGCQEKSEYTENWEI